MVVTRKKGDFVGGIGPKDIQHIIGKSSIIEKIQDVMQKNSSNRLHYAKDEFIYSHINSL